MNNLSPWSIKQHTSQQQEFEEFVDAKYSSAQIYNCHNKGLTINVMTSFKSSGLSSLNSMQHTGRPKTSGRCFKHKKKGKSSQIPHKGQIRDKKMNTNKIKNKQKSILKIQKVSKQGKQQKQILNTALVNSRQKTEEITEKNTDKDQLQFEALIISNRFNQYNTYTEYRNQIQEIHNKTKIQVRSAHSNQIITKKYNKFNIDKQNQNQPIKKQKNTTRNKRPLHERIHNFINRCQPNKIKYTQNMNTIDLESIRKTNNKKKRFQYKPNKVGFQCIHNTYVRV